MGRNGFGWLRIGTRAGFCEGVDETSGSVRKWDIF
jgi:hypothetical protein